ncbi:unnamed protein product [Trifolium pratense]|uniref:Uncharacterized protein n=1 Tax=Trifolium pratense TaxID=57577 RepID=A0ACB0I8V0_TRIPR|nr:unnamed protein product [Trifolium pratense]
MQQHLMQMQPMMAAYYPNNVTTDHIQQYLDENKSLILKIVESQNSGKLTECAENQSRLQRNLMYLAAIADSQPQPPTMPGQYPSSGMMQQGGHYMQAQQAQQMSQQQLMAARSSLLYAQQLQQQQALQSQLGTGGGFHDFGRSSTGDGLNGKQEIGNTADGRGGSSSGHSGDGGETLYLKSSGDGN